MEACLVRRGRVDVPLPQGRGLGYDLLALAVRAEAEGIDPEAALRAAGRAYRDAILAVETGETGEKTQRGQQEKD